MIQQVWDGHGNILSSSSKRFSCVFGFGNTETPPCPLFSHRECGSSSFPFLHSLQMKGSFVGGLDLALENSDWSL